MTRAFETSLVKRFKLKEAAPTLQARLPNTLPIVFSRMKSAQAQPGRSVSPPPENAFTFQIPLIRAAFTDLKYANKVIALPEIQEPGRAFLFDLSARPTVGLSTEFDNIRCYISQTTIDDLAYERGLGSIGGLMQPQFGEKDPVLFHLAQMLVPVLAEPEITSAAFLEYVALAFHEHVIMKYGGALITERRRGGRLAPWQVQSIFDYVEANLATNPSISHLAAICGLSPSFFAQAFKLTMNMAPHQWLLRRRIHRAKTMLLRTDLSLTVISSSCGFSDHSHFSRVFARIEGVSPSQWRFIRSK